MFEAYTETARRAFFLARFEASQFAFETIEVEHILLGVLRADLPLAIRLLKSQDKVDELRKRIVGTAAMSPLPVAVTGELPFSRHGKRVMAYAAAEAERLTHPYIAPEHILLGIVRENTSMAAERMLESGLTLEQLDEAAKQSNVRAGWMAKPPLIEGLRDLVAEARQGKSAPFIGRRRELDQLIQILSRRARNSAALIGEPGVGKGAILRGLAERIAEGEMPPDLLDRQILVADASELARAFGPARVTGSTLQPKLVEISQTGGAILYVRGLFDLREAMPALASLLRSGRLQMVASGTPLSFRLALEKDDQLARQFEMVRVLPPSNAEAVEIISGVKEDFERFHQVVISAEAIETAVAASGRLLRHRELPDRAIDLLDDAGAHVKLRAETLPPEALALKRQLRRIGIERDQALNKREFEKFNTLTKQEQEARQRFNTLTKEFEALPKSRTVTGDDILEVMAARLGLPVDRVKAALENPQTAGAETEIRDELAARIPVGRRDWVEGLMAYLAECSPDDASHLAQAIQSVKAKLNGG
jgi:ATP-dependent Clp protease ATP-binding subunit ClpC